eukprot:TRINITY_DN435_c0_g2_i3.p1 TRINITY_DN435_c0_g2~~TRINITY_DN435_c0_g2_i3.p1  ORF type:complete len:524 (-),score=71.49 TRINITY_DN435_c0_g2_i3:213-1784(-)
MDRIPDPPIHSSHRPLQPARRGALNYTVTDLNVTITSGAVGLIEDPVGKVVIIKVNTFLPTAAPNASANQQAFGTEFAKAASYARAGIQAGRYTKLLIDVRGNGGGYVTLATFAFWCLSGFGGSATQTLMHPGMIRKNHAFDWMASACAGCRNTDNSTLCTTCSVRRAGSLFMLDSWGPRGSNSSFESADELWCPKGGQVGTDSCKGQGWKRDQKTCSRFSQTFYDSVDLQDFATLSCPRDFGVGNAELFILSDGQCGSACSMFTRKLQDQGYAKTLTVGGQLNTPQQVASFGGGQVWNYPVVKELEMDFALVKLEATAAGRLVPTWPTDQNFPGRLPLAGQGFSFVPQEVANIERSSGALKYPGIPGEFIFTPSDMRMAYTAASVLADAILYDDARLRIEACVGQDCRWCSSEDGCDLLPSLPDCDSDSWWNPWRIALVVGGATVVIATVVFGTSHFRKQDNKNNKSVGSDSVSIVLPAVVLAPAEVKPASVATMGDSVDPEDPSNAFMSKEDSMAPQSGQV